MRELDREEEERRTKKTLDLELPRRKIRVVLVLDEALL